MGIDQPVSFLVLFLIQIIVLLAVAGAVLGVAFSLHRRHIGLLSQHYCGVSKCPYRTAEESDRRPSCEEMCSATEHSVLQSDGRVFHRRSTDRAHPC